jgi:hypothetical protein
MEVFENQGIDFIGTGGGHFRRGKNGQAGLH